MHSFLMIGQSNMAGRGYLKDVKQIYDEQVKTLINGRWHTMTEPINFDRPTSGVSLAASFAASWRLTNMNDQIGLIPCADGGSSLDDWAIDGALFENAIFHQIDWTGGVDAILGDRFLFNARYDLFPFDVSDLFNEEQR